MTQPRIVITMGDPAGIGPEIIIKALSQKSLAVKCRTVVFGDKGAMERALRDTGSSLRLVTVAPDEFPEGDGATVFLHPLSRLLPGDLIPGTPTIAGGDAVYRYIVEAARLCIEGGADAMATAPINKEILNAAGHYYPGHTELLAELTGTEEFVMMLAGSKLRVALVTIHEALKEVPQLLTKKRVLSTLRITNAALGRYFVKNPRLAVLSLNPHCGEGGMFGDEEGRIIAPAIDAARAEGIDAIGPLSADTLFHFAAQGNYDAVICMYHDQGLIPLKLLHFDDGVNVTLGLPIIRTSVDHGTAYALAGSGEASEKSMEAAISMAGDMVLLTKQEQ